MKILVMRVSLRANWVYSLKEKRMVVKSLIKKLQNTFNISVAEIEDQDIHQRITIGISSVALSSSQCYATIESIIRFVEKNTDAEIIEVEEEVNQY